MKNHDDTADCPYPRHGNVDIEDCPYPRHNGKNDYDSEDDYGKPLTREHCHPIDPRMKALLAKQPRRPIDTDVSDASTLA